ncbi:hypothetical protein TKK_0001763 [Trichogramma kaykai]|uniref:CMP/dCMP-type deaminase domain-containing protein n=1 Tax=Trichogramma kaykai TaxID=54128 RepID=A0ABD2XF71_9HYME
MDPEPPAAKMTRDLVESKKHEFTWKPQPILSKEITGDVILEKSFVAVLKDKKLISRAIQSLAKCLPIPQHLKRCSGLRIYLAPINKFQGDSHKLKTFLAEKDFDVDSIEDDLEIVNNASVAPRTKSQAAQALEHWPVNFHPDIDLEELIGGSIFEQEQLASIEACMRLAMAAAKEAAVGSAECNGSALIVDPESGSVLAIAASSMDKHPMWHASMLAVDLVAKSQGGGAWSLTTSDRSRDAREGTCKRKHPDDGQALCYPHSLAKLLDIPRSCSLNLAKTNRKKEKRSSPSDKTGPYLCTGYWAVLLREPCPLCSMALLHSRVSRIFYGAANSVTGILGSKAALHSVPGLNHRYQVWSSVLEDECARSLEQCRTIHC